MYKTILILCKSSWIEEPKKGLEQAKAVRLVQNLVLHSGQSDIFILLLLTVLFSCSFAKELRKVPHQCICTTTLWSRLGKEIMTGPMSPGELHGFEPRSPQSKSSALTIIPH